MGFITTKASNILQTHIKNTHYVGLSTTAPSESGGNFTKPSADEYEHAPIGDLDISIGAQVANNAIIYFPEAVSSWGTITHFGLFESKSSTVPYFWGELTTPVTITVTDPDGDTYVPIFRAHALVIGLDKAELGAYE